MNDLGHEDIMVGAGVRLVVITCQEHGGMRSGNELDS